MRIGLLGPFPPYRGGIASFDYHLHRSIGEMADHEAIGLNYRNLYPSILFPGKTQFDESDCPFPEVARPAFSPQSPWQWPHEASALCRMDLDALIVSWWHPFFALPLRAVAGGWRRRTGRPLAAICHNARPHEPIPCGERLRRLLFSRVDVFVTHWQGDREFLAGEDLGRRILPLFHPLYDGFPGEPALTRQDARKRLGLPIEGPVLLFFGLIRPYKGLDVLLSALSDLEMRVGSFTCVVAGEFYGDRSRYEAPLREWEAKGRLKLFDSFIPNEDVQLFFTAADAVVLPYRHATQSGVVPLALQWGRAVVSTEVGGLPEAVLNEVSGILVPPDNPSALADGIVRCLASQARLEEGARNLALRRTFRSYADDLVQSLSALLIS